MNPELVIHIALKNFISSLSDTYIITRTYDHNMAIRNDSINNLIEAMRIIIREEIDNANRNNITNPELDSDFNT